MSWWQILFRWLTRRHRVDRQSRDALVLAQRELCDAVEAQREHTRTLSRHLRELGHD